jgi:hypothetical protein
MGGQQRSTSDATTDSKPNLLGVILEVIRAKIPRLTRRQSMLLATVFVLVGVSYLVIVGIWGHKAENVQGTSLTSEGDGNTVMQINDAHDFTVLAGSAKERSRPALRTNPLDVMHAAEVVIGDEFSLRLDCGSELPPKVLWTSNGRGLLTAAGCAASYKASSRGPESITVTDVSSGAVLGRLDFSVIPAIRSGP